MADLYYKDMTERVLKLLQDNLSDSYGIAAYYDGDPVMFGASSLPAVCVLRQKSNYDLSATQTDELTSTTLIKIVLDKRDDYGASATVDLTDLRLRKIIEARDQTTGQYLPESVLGVLRTFYTMSYSNPLNPIIRSVADVSYHLIDRSSPADQDLLTMEGHVRLNVTERVVVQSRS